MNLTITLSLEEVNLILEVLSHQPYRNVKTTVEAVKAQADAQLKPRAVPDDA